MDDLEPRFNRLSAGMLDERFQKEVKEAIFSCERMSGRELMEKTAARYGVMTAGTRARCCSEGLDSLQGSPNFEGARINSGRPT